MALTQIIDFDVDGVPIDTRAMTCGWHGQHASLREATMFEPFGIGGSVSVGSATVAVPSQYPIPFKVVRRDSTGATTDVLTGTFPANAYSSDAQGMALSAASFPTVSPTDSYAIVPNGSLVPSAIKPGYFVWSEAPVDGSGFVIDLVILVA
jgi:hypothetical protein